MREHGIIRQVMLTTLVVAELMACGRSAAAEPPAPPQCRSQPTKFWVDFWGTAIGRECPRISCREVGRVYSRTNPQHVMCRRQGDEVHNDRGQHNHWWLLMELDTGGRGWVSAYHIKGQGNNQAVEMCTGQPIPECPRPPGGRVE